MVVIFETKKSWNQCFVGCRGSQWIVFVFVLLLISNLFLFFVFARIEIGIPFATFCSISYANQLTVDCVGMQNGLMGPRFMGAFCETPLSVCIKGVLMRSIVMLSHFLRGFVV